MQTLFTNLKKILIEHGGNSSNADNNKPAFSPCSFWLHPGCSFGHIVHQEIFEKPCPGHLLCGWAGWSGMLSPLLRMPQERSLRSLTWRLLLTKIPALKKTPTQET